MAELRARELAAFGLGVLATLGALNAGVVHARLVPSGSMAPTFEPGDRLLIRSADPLKRAPRRFEIWVFDPPLPLAPGHRPFFAAGSRDPYVKRVIGLPGETVQVRPNDGVYVNGLKLDEPYVAAPAAYAFGPERVPPGRYFMLGDNRNASFDSHYWGGVPLAGFTGRPCAIFWPPDRAGLL